MVAPVKLMREGTGQMARTGLNGPYRWAGFLLGFALGGFFDGVLLHQILQWHHLLSAIEGTDIRFQVAADGYFHALMYVIALVGLWVLWNARSGLRQPTDRLMLAAMSMGFGIWHIVDGILSHWVLGIHRIRMDSANPLLWDLLWFFVFGVVPAALSWWISRRGGDGEATLSGPSAASGLLVLLLVIGAGVQAMLPMQASEFATVLFVPGTPQERIFNAVKAVEGRVAWTDGTGELVVIHLPTGQSRLSLFRHGAILVSGSAFPAGCFDYFKI